MYYSNHIHSFIHSFLLQSIFPFTESINIYCPPTMTRLYYYLELTSFQENNVHAIRQKFIWKI